MNIIGYMNKIYSVGRYLVLTVILANIVSVSFATDGAAASICGALTELCQASQTFLGGAIMVMIVLAGATYAIGQVLGAETRARASVWATAMMTGALIGAIIYLIAPMILRAMLPETVVPAGDDPCAFQC